MRVEALRRCNGARRQSNVLGRCDAGGGHEPCRICSSRRARRTGPWLSRRRGRCRSAALRPQCLAGAAQRESDGHDLRRFTRDATQEQMHQNHAAVHQKTVRAKLPACRCERSPPPSPPSTRGGVQTRWTPELLRARVRDHRDRIPDVGWAFLEVWAQIADKKAIIRSVCFHGAGHYCALVATVDIGTEGAFLSHAV